ncbi:uncharacterized protein LOC110887744 [Helianthus annuus]|uniref:uncharacterized protein LOC110887744 n=1 Tax=Helianthus annuus TaxID=4232 RepID=UPI000B8FDDED|nr:uncharacterized protein LOC110887744 [Helianthus annuus]
MDLKSHPALMVTNIRNFVPFTLEMEGGQYNSWAELFKIHCKAFLVYDHIDATATPPTVSTPKPTPFDKEVATPETKLTSQEDVDLWHRLDAIVIQWIYNTISNDLLHTIIKTNATALEAWTSLEDIFQDSKNERAYTFNTNLSPQGWKTFRTCSRIVRLSRCSPINFQTSQINPLPGFYEVRSRLCMEESQKANQAKHEAVGSSTALTVQQQRTSADNRNYAPRGPGGRYRGHGGRNGNGGRGSGQPPSYGRGYNTFFSS